MKSTTRPPHPNELRKAYIKEVLDHLLQPGQVVELRCLIRPGRTIAGYFDDFDKMAAEAARLSGTGTGVYLTPNPCLKSLLARCANRTKDFAGATTSDVQIIRRRYFLLDLDPKRPSGTPSCNADHQAAIALAYEVRDWLQAEFNFLDIVVADSGNGAHLMTPVDIPCDPATADAANSELFKNAITAVALRFDTDALGFDQTVFNPARIWKVYGTQACKGDPLADQPHRFSKLLEKPEPLRPTPIESIQRLAATLPVTPKNAKHEGSFNIDAWIGRYLPDVIGPAAWQSGRKWILRVCPWNPEHTNRSAYIIELPSGAIAAGCHHNGCSGNDWRALRGKFDPDRHERKPGSSGSSTDKKEEPPKATHHFTLVSAHDVMTAEDVDEPPSILEGILPAGGMSLAVAKPKVGKTTWAFNLAVAVSRGEEFLGRKTEQGPVVFLALEEKRGEIKKKLKAAGLTEKDPLKFHFGSAPINAMAEVEPLIVETKAKLLVIDVLQKFCKLRDLNDYAIVSNALEPLMAAARKQGCHILLTHHAGKADRPDGDDILGSTGLLGGVDTLIMIKKRDKRRVFFTIQRYGDDIDETVIDLGEDGTLRAVGSRQAVDIEETNPLILATLKDSDPLTINEIYDRVEKNKSLVSKAVAILVKTEQVYRSGEGKRQDPYKYSSFPPSSTNGGGKEETKTPDIRAECKEESLPGNSELFSTGRGGIGEAFSAPKIRPKKDAQNSSIVDDALRILGGRVIDKE